MSDSDPRRGLSGSGNGAAEDADDPLVGEIPAPIWELAENCRSFVLQALGVELDFEPETLPVLDAYLAGARRDLEGRPEALPLISRAAGAYFGEVARRRVDGMWRRPPDPGEEWKLCGRRAFFAFSPVGMVLDTLALGAEHSGPPPDLELGPDDAEVAAARLAAMPPVPEDEYYLMSTRLDVLEVVVDALREQMKREGRESLVFEESDYD